MLCPIRKNDEGFAEEPNEAELNRLRNDSQKLETIRLRLSDIAWWMRLRPARLKPRSGGRVEPGANSAPG